MPIPKPTGGEKQSDFISRCMGNDIMVSEYPDQKQRAAICHTSWRDNMKKDMKLESVKMNGIHIADVGKWNGFDFSEKRFDECIKNFNEKVCEPYLTLNHEGDVTEEVAKVLKFTGLGYVSKLWKDGKKLMADFKQVPKLIAELINAGALKQRSIEFWNKFPHANGKTYGNVLEGVTFHGADGLPAMNTLDDIPKLFKGYDLSEKIKSTEQDEDKEKVSIPFKKEVKPMGNELENNEVAVPKQEYNDLLKAKATLDKLTMDIEAKDAEIVTFKTTVSTKDEEIAKMQLKSDEADKKLEEVNKTKDGILEKEATGYIDARIEAKQELPKYRDMKIADYIRISKEGDDEALKLFKSELEDRDPLIFSTISKENGAGEESDEGNVKMDYKTEKEALEKEDVDMDKMEAEIKVVMKREKCDWNTAAKKLDYIRDSEGGDQ